MHDILRNSIVLGVDLENNDNESMGRMDILRSDYRSECWASRSIIIAQT